MKYFDGPVQQKAFKQTGQNFGQVLLFFGLLVLAGQYLLGLNTAPVEHIYCDAERQVLHQGFPSFEQEGRYFGGGEKQSEEIAHSGKYSVKLSKEQAFGLEYEYAIVAGNEHFVVTVWRYRSNRDVDNGLIVASVPELFWQGDSKIIEREEGSDWEKIELRFSPNKKCDHKLLKIYCWNNGRDPVYFDDLAIEIRREEPL